MVSFCARNHWTVQWLSIDGMESLIHAAVIPPGTPHPIQKTEQAIVEMLMGYLCGGSRRIT